MIDPMTVSLNYIKKEPFTGSVKGMRFRLIKSGDDMEVCIWPEPYNFLKTPDDKKQFKTFPLTIEGRDDAVEWLNEQYEVQNALWSLAAHTPL